MNSFPGDARAVLALPCSKVSSQSEMKCLLKLLAPYLAVTLFWCVWPNAWFAILAYHAQILAWVRPDLRGMRWAKGRGGMLLAIPTVLAGPAVYILLPMITRTDLSAWLNTYRVSGSSLLLMIPYFGLVHPVMEQMHWHSLRRATAWSHPGPAWHPRSHCRDPARMHPCRASRPAC